MSNVLKGTVVNPETIYGKSAYEIAVMNGFDGTEEEWLYSLAEEANTIAKAYADNAGASAQRAEEAKAAAETAETNAQGSAESAEESASAASASAQSAGSAADRAEAAAEEAETHANEARGYADNANVSAGAAATSEQEAQKYAQGAFGHRQGAEEAQTSAERAKVAAVEARDNASYSAQEASASAQIAAVKAGEADVFAKDALKRASEAGGYANTAKAAADRAEAAAEEARLIVDEFYPEIPLTWEAGAIDGTLGTDTATDTTCRTVGFIDVRPIHSISVVKAKAVFGYDQEQRYLGYFSINANTTIYPSDILALGKVAYIRIRASWNETVDIVDKVTIIEDSNLKKSLAYIDELDKEFTEHANELGEKITELANEPYQRFIPTWESGAINGDSGAPYDSDIYKRTVEFIDARNIHSITTSVKLMLFAYNSKYEFVGRESEVSDSDRSYDDVLALGDDVKYIRMRVGAGADVEGITIMLDKCRMNTNARFDDIDQRFNDYTITEYPIEWKQGYITGDGIIVDNDDRKMLGVYAEKIEVSTFVKATTGNKLYFRIYAYDANGTLLGYLDYVARGGTFTQSFLTEAYPEATEMRLMVYYASNIETTVSDVEQYTTVYCLTYASERAKTNARLDEIDKQEYWLKQRQRFNDKPIMIAYSHGADLGHINTELAYVNAAIAGFRWLKGDVQPTSDGKLVMCHDDGFTFDSDGYITTYDANSENTRAIHDMTYAECMASEYAKTYHINTTYVNGTGTKVEYRPKVCDLERFLIVCKEFEVQPYIVIRTNYMNVVVPELLRLLEAYDFTDHCIVNSFALESVRQVAEQSNHRVMISVVKEYTQDNALTNEEVDTLLSVSPNCTINIYTGSNTAMWNNVKLAEASKEAISYAKSLGVVVGTAFVKEPHELFAKGIGLMQCDTLCVQPKVTTIPLCVSLLDGDSAVEISGAYSRRFTADTRISGNSLFVEKIRLIGSNRDFSDGITPNLAGIFPYSLSVVGDLSSNITSVKLNYNNSIQIIFDTNISSLDTSSKKRFFVKFVYGI